MPYHLSLLLSGWHVCFEVQNSRFSNIPSYHGISCIINMLHCNSMFVLCWFLRGILGVFGYKIVTISDRRYQLRSDRDIKLA